MTISIVVPILLLLGPLCVIIILRRGSFSSHRSSSSFSRKKTRTNTNDHNRNGKDEEKEETYGIVADIETKLLKHQEITMY